MKWWLVCSFLGAAWGAAGFVLSLVFGPALPISALAMGLSLAPVLLIGFVVLRGTNYDHTYRTLHRFSTAAKRLALLYVLLLMSGAAISVTSAAGMPTHLGSRPLSAAEHYATLVDPLRLTAGVVLMTYAVVGLLTLIRMHYRPPVVRR
jgi:hypothetical protein